MKPALRGAGLLGAAAVAIIVGAVAIAYFVIGTADSAGDPPRVVQIGESGSEADLDDDDRDDDGDRDDHDDRDDYRPAPGPDTADEQHPRVQVIPPGMTGGDDRDDDWDDDRDDADDWDDGRDDTDDWDDDDWENEWDDDGDD